MIPPQDETPPTRQPGIARSIGPYRLISRLGAGAMGEVWRALDTRLDRIVALKLLPSAFATDPDRRARMQREARAAAAVGHSSVVTVHDVGSDGGEDYLVMELVEGETLADRLRRGPMPAAEALRVIASVTGALAAAHRKGILHRDVKAANVMLAHDGSVKVLDFGLAKLRGQDPSVPPSPLGSPSPHTPVPELVPQGKGPELALSETMPSGGGTHATQEGTMLGTPAYFSPEQARGRLPDEKSEVFSAGVLAYEVLTGRSPFVGQDLATLTASILQGQIVAPQGPPAAVAAVMRALERPREARFPDMQSFHAAIEAARARLARKRRWPLVALVGGVVAALAATVIILVARGGPAERRSPVARYLEQALGEWNLFYNDKARASLAAAARMAPDDPRPDAYLILTDVAPDPGKTRAAATHARAQRQRVSGRDRALVDAAVRLAEAGPAAARAPLASFVGHDDELTFWDAELAYRAQAFVDADRGYQRLAERGGAFRGRIYDHEVAVLLTLGDTAGAARLGAAYAAAFPGEADALGVHATALAAAGQTDEALALAQAALDLNDSEDTWAGLGKVQALRGELAQAMKSYQASIDKAPVWRRPLRRAALAAIYVMEGRVDDARQITAPCLPGAAEASERTTSVCLVMAALADVTLTDQVVAALERLALAPPPEVPYGEPAKLARLLRARARLDAAASVDPRLLAELDELLVGADELFVGYHVPFLATYAVRLRAQARILAGDHASASALLAPVVKARPGDVPCLLLLARAQAGQGDRAAALGTVERVLAVWKQGDPGAAYLGQARRMRSDLGTL